MRIALVLALVLAFAVSQPFTRPAQADGPPTFSVELVDFPTVIQRGQTLEGHVRIENRGAKSGEFGIQTYVDTQYGPAVLLTRVTVTVGAGETAVTPFSVGTAALEAGDYEVTIAVKRRRDILIVPLRFTVQ